MSTFYGNERRQTKKRPRTTFKCFKVSVLFVEQKVKVYKRKR